MAFGDKKPNTQGTYQVGFKRVEDGWHLFQFAEGIGKVQNKEGELAKDKNGNQLWKFPLIVVDEDDSDNGVSMDHVVSENDQGEQFVIDALGTVGKFDAFAKAFPNAASVFEQTVIEKIMASKNQLTGCMIRYKTKQSPNKKSPDNPYVNIAAFGPVAKSIEALEAELGLASKDEKGGKKESKKAKVVEEDEPF